ncbi:MAG: hypothetical protein IKR34_00575 [Candidatus Gastranaerophilales bacterium]|nr:hypothetical protein [Candidatus Gastranaerophilales bacterium]
MISKILLNGKNRYALIFDEVTTGEDIAEMRNALIELVAMASNETITDTDRFYALQVVKALTATTGQIHDFLSLYFDGKKPVSKECFINCKISI